MLTWNNLANFSVYSVPLWQKKIRGNSRSLRHPPSMQLIPYNPLTPFSKGE